MEPNDLPIVCLPLNLSDESVASLIEFLHELIEALERHYAGQLLRRDHQQAADRSRAHLGGSIRRQSTILIITPACQSDAVSPRTSRQSATAKKSACRRQNRAVLRRR